ncbi:hypothetical protein A2Y68_00160 [Candidatus Woesebacteria bacterium RBG_13_46_13]|uniref:Uncharacterized protein n=1 Tax=Candidatus Woesebacteria bacterium RBG_13_46_13 TaxID=1802479 RepID=A0A1F7X318_9BACT|nr:MAG: hypothetical protein A2Y68_00160 [Candidatus Woesebacteria bacterium RBG_13_46_13]
MRVTFFLLLVFSLIFKYHLSELSTLVTFFAFVEKYRVEFPEPNSKTLFLRKSRVFRNSIDG